MVVELPGTVEPEADVELPATDVDELSTAVVDEPVDATEESLGAAEVAVLLSGVEAADEAGAAAVLGGAAEAAADEGADAGAAEAATGSFPAGAGLSAASAGAAAMVAVATRDEIVRKVLRDMSTLIGLFGSDVRLAGRCFVQVS